MNRAETHTESSGVPLFVDLDGSLVRTDLLMESILSVVRVAPLSLLTSVKWFLQGRARLKKELAQRAEIDIMTIPLRTEVVDFVAIQASRGRRVFLSTASNCKLADAMAKRLGLFTGVLASDNSTNLKGKYKLSRIKQVADGAFDYIGNAPEDLAIWREAREAILVNPSAAVELAARQQGNVTLVLRDSTSLVRTALKALRLHQWLKNILIFLPLFTSLRLGDTTAWAAAIIAYLAFSFVASASYIVNDLLDLASDRAHPRKRCRPFASGQLMPQAGVWLFFGLLFLAMALAWFANKGFGICLFVYFVLTLTYSFVLKTLVIMDVIVLAGLYSMRVIAGAVAIGVPLSFWLIAFSVFLFYGLALVKRCAELSLMDAHQLTEAKGRDYKMLDIPTLRALGSASGLASVVVFALYISAPENSGRFGTPMLLWLICPALMYWLGRMWIITGRGEMHDDPLVFAAEDRISQCAILFMCAMFAAASVIR